MKEEVILKGTRKNPLRVEGLRFEDAIILAKYTTFNRCRFIDCVRKFEDHCGCILCDDGEAPTFTAKNVAIP